MARGGWSVSLIEPGARRLAHTLAKFGAREGIVTAFSDRRLKLAQRLAPDGGNLEFVPFGDVVRRAMVALGAPTATIPGGGQIRATVGRICEDIGPESPFFLSRNRPGFHRRLVDNLDLLRHHEVDLTAIDLEPVMDPTVREKLEALTTVERGLGAALSAAGRERLSDRLRRSLDMDPSGSLPLSRILVLADGEDRPLPIRWLEWLARAGVSVRVAAEDVAGAPGAFAASRRIALRAGLETPRGGTWYAPLFGGRALEPAPRIVLASAPDPLSEAESAVRTVLARLDEDVLPHRVGIFLADAELYGPLVIASARRLGVQISFSRRAPLMGSRFARLTIGLLEALAEGDLRRLADFVGSSPLGMSPVEARRCADSLRSLAGDGEAGWRALGEASPAWLAEAARWRLEALDEPTLPPAWLDRLRLLVGLTPLIDFGEGDEDRRDQHAQTAMQRAVADFASARMGDERRYDLPEFAQLCARLWENEEMVVPGLGSGVEVAAAPDAFGDLDTLIAVGMLEGVMPVRRREDPILNDDDVRAINALARPEFPVPDSGDRVAAKRDDLYRLCSAASRMLVFSHPRSASDRETVPAYFLADLGRLFPVERRDEALHDFAPTRDQCLSPADLRLRLALEDGVAPLIWPQIESEEARKAMRPDWEAGVEIDELAAAFDCPFQAGFFHRLRVRPEAGRRAMRALMRLPIEARLAVQPTREDAEAALADALERSVRRLAGRLEAWEIAMLRTAAGRFGRAWIEREFEARDQWPRDPSTIRVALAADEGAEPIRWSGRNVRLTGTLPYVAKIGPLFGIGFYERELPEKFALSGEDDSRLPPSREAVRWMLSWASRREFLVGQGFVFEVDAATPGFRALFTICEPNLLRSYKSKAGLKQRMMARNYRTLKEAARVAFDRVATIVEQATAVPTPSRDGCRACSLGDLCRVSHEFGEQRPPTQAEDVEDDVFA